MSFKKPINKLRPMCVALSVFGLGFLFLSHASQAAPQRSCQKYCIQQSKVAQKQCLANGYSHRECNQVKQDAYDQCMPGGCLSDPGF